MEFKDRLREKRKERGLTQKQLSERAGISFTSYGKYERGERIPDIDNMTALAQVLQTSVAELAGDLDRYRSYQNLVSNMEPQIDLPSTLNKDMVDVIQVVFSNSKTLAGVLLNDMNSNDEDLIKVLEAYLRISEQLLERVGKLCLENNQSYFTGIILVTKNMIGNDLVKLMVRKEIIYLNLVL